MTNGCGSSPGLRVVLPPRRRPSPRYYVYNKAFLRALQLADGVLSILRHFWPKPAVPARPSRILVSNCADFGDVVLVLPALEALRGLFPQAQIGFLSSAKTVPVLAGTGLVDRHHVVEGRLLDILKREQGLSRLKALWRFIRARQTTARELRAAGYDVALDLYLFPFPASPLLYMAGIPVRAGFASGGFGPLLTHPVEPGAEPRPIFDSPRDVISALWPSRAADLPAFEPSYPGHPRHEIAPFEDGGRYWVVHMGAGAVYKEWPEAQWRDLLATLLRRGVRFVLTGSGARERERIERTIAAMGSAGIRGFTDRPWAEFVAVVARAERVICLDSSIVHVAAAFRVPTTALFTGINDLREWRPASDVCGILMAPVGCAPCNRRDCIELLCLRGLSADDVLLKL
ncbi:ADP-heptose--LPS heptosyltransferase [Aliidongia dinghuensis]|uniref:ADP-heptose--LPS heptosyltransferase n=1 Tax=Aliidongia dinghuensis TaxID=1867774 RepID=A0A8J3E358_9PROT|nr:glycosyltransferase family 9 protein [Aliidongia dinghuensis]GGF27500.1 ADP-heptose--LPS heptosyltransferase [Aliidongia dinghuensis]